MYFAARCGVSAMLLEYRIVHLEGLWPSIVRMTPCKRASGKAEGRKLTFRGLTFLPPYVAATLVNVEGKIAEVSRLLFSRVYS